MLRVMTYNILQGGRRGQALHDVVRAAAPDLLLLNECPKAPVLWRRRCLRLTRTWGLRYVVGGRTAGSNLIAARADIGVKSASAVKLPQPAFAPRRGIASAQLRVHGRLLGVVSCHLSLDPGRRVDEVERALEVVSRLRGPVILGGDLNERPDGPAWHLLRQAGFVDHGGPDWKTFPAADPDRRIDALLVRGDLAVVRHGDPGVPTDLLALGSDHRPVLAVLDV